MALILVFIASIILNVDKYSLKNTVVTESTRSAAEVVYPSITICPVYKGEYALSKTSGTKNLTEYYDSLLNVSDIKNFLISISQPYVSKNG